MITQMKIKPAERVFIGGSRAGKSFPQQGALHYRPACPVVVHASANDELPDPKAPRYA